MQCLLRLSALRHCASDDLVWVHRPSLPPGPHMQNSQKHHSRSGSSTISVQGPQHPASFLAHPYPHIIHLYVSRVSVSWPVLCVSNSKETKLFPNIHTLSHSIIPSHHSIARFALSPTPQHRNTAPGLQTHPRAHPPAVPLSSLLRNHHQKALEKRFEDSWEQDRLQIQGSPPPPPNELGHPRVRLTRDGALS